MRTIDEIKSDFRKPDADFAELMDELFNTVARDIPFSRFEEICHAERDGRCVIFPRPVTASDVEVLRDIGRIARNSDDMERWKARAEAALKGGQHEP